jgi:hypothetical protein
VRKICAFIVAAAVLVLSAPIAARASTVTYKFIGQCADCSGTGIGYLTLSDYTLGTDLSNSNFVSFTYQSNLIDPAISYTGIGSALDQIDTIIGKIPSSLPSIADVQLIRTISAGPVIVFESTTSGYWCASAEPTYECVSDYGFSHSWSVTPIPPALPLCATGLGALGLLGWRGKRKQAAV